MKKRYLLLALLFNLNLHTFPEIIRWKGMEIGKSPEPAWLIAYLTDKNEKLIRKKFDVKKSKTIIVGYGNAPSLEVARTASQIDAQNQLYKSIEIRGKSKRFDFIYEYWFEDSESAYNVYSIYVE